MGADRKPLYAIAGIGGAVAVIAGIVAYNAFLTAPADQSTNGADTIPSRFRADTLRHGSSYGDWTAMWWKWALQAPEEVNPVLDETGENCAQGQDGPVWFLAGSFGGLVVRDCEIPGGKDLLFPLMNAECSEVEYPEIRTDDDLVDCSVSANEGITELMVSVNGMRIEESELRTYRVQSSVFEVDLPAENILGQPAGTTRAASDGYWVWMEPLPPGNHIVHFRGVIPDPTIVATNNFVTEAEYHITVLG